MSRLGGPDGSVLRMLGHVQDVETNVDEADVSGQLQKIHYLHVLIQALKPDKFL